MDEDHDQTKSEAPPTPKSFAESSEQDIFSRSSTVKSSEPEGILERSNTNSTIEYLMTEQEKHELDKRLEDVVDRLQRQKDEFDQWEQSLNKRRLLAFGRLKALGRFHRQRMDVYDTVKNYLRGMNSQSANTSNKQSDNKSSGS